MKERPILFSAPMVRALLAGTKTQTRRTAKVPRSPWPWEPEMMTCEGLRNADFTPASFPPYPVLTNSRTGKSITCPYGAPGDRLWVRETWRARVDSAPVDDEMDAVFVRYEADGVELRFDESVMGIEWSLPLAARKARAPSIYMPRWASRITLEITDVRVERLQAISEDDARAEGIAAVYDTNIATFGTPEGLVYRPAFHTVWNAINGKTSPWSENAWVWALTFRRLP